MSCPRDNFAAIATHEQFLLPWLYYVWFGLMHHHCICTVGHSYVVSCPQFPPFFLVNYWVCCEKGQEKPNPSFVQLNFWTDWLLTCFSSFTLNKLKIFILWVPACFFLLALSVKNFFLFKMQSDQKPTPLLPFLLCDGMWALYSDPS